MTRRRPRAVPGGWRASVVGLAAALAVVLVGGLLALSSRPVTDRVATDHRAAVREVSVRPVVSDRIGELGTVEAVIVRPTPPRDPDTTVHLLGPIGEARARVAVIRTPTRLRLAVDGRLGDGRPYEVLYDAVVSEYTSLFTTGADGGTLEISGRMTFDELVDVAEHIDVGREGVTRHPAGWIELADGPMPPWRNGMTTIYEFLGGRRLRITVEPATAGREALAAYGTTERIDIGIGDWAFRYRPPNAGMLVRIDDVVVDLVGDFSDPELMTAAYSLREMRPGEHPIEPPEGD